MQRRFVAGVAFGWAVAMGSAIVVAGGQAVQSVKVGGGLLHSTRQAPSDLEITGMVRGLAGGSSQFVRYADLGRLPQIKATVDDDADFPGVTMHITGIDLTVLARALGALPSSDLIDAMCSDGYRSHYPADYVAAHHPVLVLTIDGVTPTEWAASAHQEDPGPYLIVYKHFVPAFKVLSHVDRPALPTNVIRLNFSTTAATFGPIAPRGSFAPGSPEQEGFAIAKQNCLRCHSQESIGGTKSDRSWAMLSAMARKKPAAFAAYIHDPNAAEGNEIMPPNPEYDAATLDALTAYFRTFTADGTTGAAAK